MGEIIAIVWRGSSIVATMFCKDKLQDDIVTQFKANGVLMLGDHVVIANVVSSVSVVSTTQPAYLQLAPYTPTIKQ